MNKLVRSLLWTISIAFLIYLLLLIPDSKNADNIEHAPGKAFTWGKDALWKKLENDFINARQYNKLLLDSMLQQYKQVAEKGLANAANTMNGLADSSLLQLESNFFSIAALVAAKSDEKDWFINSYNRFRKLVKLRSHSVDMSLKSNRDIAYQLLYGLRAAIEEVLLQQDSMRFDPAMQVTIEPSQTPAASIFGIEVHSGDLLVSRGGAEVSALIARGNDYPGNFSHVALLYVDEQTRKPYLVEAHIERGVAVSSVDQYEKDKKLRFMVMRPRADLPVMIADPMLPHKAAKTAYEEAMKRHIPYDFKMDFHDSAAMFCSEVASYAYRKNGLQFWQPVSTISSAGLVNWLHDFGVEHFVTQMPSDLEYDPQLSIVAEWCDPEALFKDHVDNAVIDAMLEKAGNGTSIGYSYWKLPFVRVLKFYCMIQNSFGKSGLIPEGMSATRALKNQRFVAVHKEIKERTLQEVKRFIDTHHYHPPYWQLVRLASEAAGKQAIW